MVGCSYNSFDHKHLLPCSPRRFKRQLEERAAVEVAASTSAVVNSDLNQHFLARWRADHICNLSIDEPRAFTSNVRFAAIREMMLVPLRLFYPVAESKSSALVRFEMREIPRKYSQLIANPGRYSVASRYSHSRNCVCRRSIHITYENVSLLDCLNIILPFNYHLKKTTRMCMGLWLALAVSVVGARSPDFPTCLAEVRSGKWGQTGGTDNQGRPVANISDATAITYELCKVACGSGRAAFQWNVFSQQFAAWLLPYLALISQLPFGARSRLDNVVSMLLTVGSPTLAAYSLTLTILNGHWIAQRFYGLSYSNVKNAVKILTSLQQSPLQVNTEDALLASLVVLHSNDDFWEELAEWLDVNFVHTWSISAVVSILWVIVAYIFTVVDSFTGEVSSSMRQASGQAVGSAFLWLLPIVIGWLQISPKCDSERLHQAMDKANKIAYVATMEDEPTLASDISDKRAIYIRKSAGEVHRDEQSTPPIYNYARFLSWTLAVEHVYHAFREASERSSIHQPVNLKNQWAKGDKTTRIHHMNRRGCQKQVTAYVNVESTEIFPLPRSRWGSGIVSRFLLAAFAALCLTWGTTGAAIVTAYFTPTRGLACRSGSYLLYGANSTMVWILLVTSSVLAHYSTFTVAVKGRYMHTKATRLAGVLSIILRRLGKVLASLNAIWIVLACLFQFSSFFDRCWCDSSVFYLGAKNAFNVIDVSASDLASARVPWYGGVALASGCAIVFLGCVNVLINPALPDYQ
ncbi:hypothetical protein MSAN_01225500 [Mycena sanguinolenta]|uniref:Uncharacterized protein n=1 Tax=Mycena sanguinolenta TaxID=230812 RepID=A0A8H7D2A7_9AGAR|nr:hypothetical protein MSAN_01225500 [Mycena sanguinolenta]